MMRRAASWVTALGFGLLAVLPAAAQQAAPTDAPTVTTALGTLRGTTLDAGRTAAFLGIPYAQPPVGALRFQAPRAASAWAPATRDATRFQPACMQQGKLPADIGMAEDCLYLNVYVPASARAPGASSAGLPVMVFLHGGRYWTGRSSENKGEYLANRENVIVVTPAYRLNAFGFLANAEQARAGHANAGLQDQQLALRWVARHIGAFGGNPANVTLFGESAGGGSVLMHLLADSSKGLFKQAILQSTWQWRLPTLAEATRGTQQLAAAQGCPTAGPAALDCLRALPADKLLPSLANSHLFQPTVDGRWLKAQPQQLLREGGFDRNVAVMLGVNAQEGGFMAMSRTGWKKPTDAVPDKLFEQAASAALSPFYAPQQVDDILSWYAPTRSARGNWQALSQLFEDFYINCGSYDAAQALLRHSRKPVHGYWFAHVSAQHDKPFLGAAHGDELPFLFDAPVYLPGYAFTPQDRALSQRMMASWAAMARHGVPATAATPSWRPMSAQAPLAQVWAEPASGAPHRFSDPSGRCERWRPLLG
jgi:para-nitrobenzyl esterase